LKPGAWFRRGRLLSEIARIELFPPGQLTRPEWTARLNDQWDRIRETAVEGFIQLGRDLHAAKADLGKHGGWVEMVTSDLEFHRRIANMFMRIAKWIDENRGIASNLLPPDYTTISAITRLDDKTLKRLIKDGTICPT
jgi:hypothetical protein